MASLWPEPRHKATAASTPSWAQEGQDPVYSTKTKPASTASAGRRPGSVEADQPPRDVASMKREIAQLQAETTQSLDRAIAAAQAASSVGGHVAEELHEQREQMGRIDADARDTEAVLKHTAYHLKHGFTWRGALTSPFRRGPKAPPLKGGTHKDISPVFTDEYTTSIPSKSPARGKNQPASGSTATSAPSHAGGLFGGRSPKGKKEAADALARQINKNRSGPTAAAVSGMPPSAGHVPEGFDAQLDVLDELMDGLKVQAQAINTELRQQNEGIEVLAGRIEPAAAETASQARQIRRKFGVRAR